MFRKSIEIDFRSLLSFRLLFFTTFAVDLCFRLFRLDLYYSDAGYLSRELAFDSAKLFVHPLLFSTGEPYLVAGFFILGILACLFIVIGFRTRLFLALLWLLWASISDRNPYINDGSGPMRAVVVFWCLFLPWGELDEWLKESHRNRTENGFASVAGFCLLFQIGCIYFFSGLLKSNREWSSHPVALAKILDFQSVTTPLAQTVLQFRGLLGVLTRLLRWLEVLAPLFLFFGGLSARVRMLGVLLLIIMHFAIVLFLHIGAFPFFCIALLCLALPGLFWEIGAWRWLGVHFDILARLRFIQSKTETLWHQAWKERSVFLTAASLLALIFVFALNLSAIGFIPERPLWLQAFAQAFSVDQRWNFYSNPPSTDIWYIAAGSTADGHVLDFFKSPLGPVEWKKPENFQNGIYPDEFKRKYFERITWNPKEKRRLAAYGEFLCRKAQISRLELFQVFEPSSPHYPDIQRVKLLDLKCQISCRSQNESNECDEVSLLNGERD